MKAPSKIYAKIIAGTLYASREPNEVFGEDYSEYVRKDALVEWASDRLGMVSDLGFDNGDVEHGYTRALQVLIDKLNSM